MAWTMVAAAGISVAGNYFMNKDKGGGSSGSGGSPVAAADPFASQRQMYQPMLAQLMGAGGSGSGAIPFPRGGGGGSVSPFTGDGPMSRLMGGVVGGVEGQFPGGMIVPPGSQPSPIGGGSNPSANGNLQARQQMASMAAGGGQAQSLFGGLTNMLTPGSNFQTSDPSYQFRLQQGMDAVNRGSAQSGGLGSGNQLAELMKYGQGMASQEFQNQFARQQSAVATAGQLETQKFGELAQVDQNDQNIFQNNYARLAQLSGANSGQPGMAGQLMASQQAGAAAGWQQLGSAALGGIKSLWNSANAPDYSYSGTGTGTLPGGGADPTYGQYENTPAPVDPMMDW